MAMMKVVALVDASVRAERAARLLATEQATEQAHAELVLARIEIRELMEEILVTRRRVEALVQELDYYLKSLPPR